MVGVERIARRERAGRFVPAAAHRPCGSTAAPLQCLPHAAPTTARTSPPAHAPAPCACPDFVRRLSPDRDDATVLGRSRYSWTTYVPTCARYDGGPGDVIHGEARLLEESQKLLARADGVDGLMRRVQIGMAGKFERIRGRRWSKQFRRAHHRFAELSGLLLGETPRLRTLCRLYAVHGDHRASGTEQLAPSVDQCRALLLCEATKECVRADDVERAIVPVREDVSVIGPDRVPDPLRVPPVQRERRLAQVDHRDLGVDILGAQS